MEAIPSFINTWSENAENGKKKKGKEEEDLNRYKYENTEILLKSKVETCLLTISGETFDDQQQRQQRFAIIVMLLQERVEHFNGIKHLYF